MAAFVPNNASSGSVPTGTPGRFNAASPRPLPEPLTPLGALSGVFRADPTIGLAVIDVDGRILFANDRIAMLYVGEPVAKYIGVRIADVDPQAWHTERAALYEEVARSRRPVVLRQIRRGVQLQTTIHPVDSGEGFHFLITAVEGQSDFNADEEVDVRESGLVHLGPLAVLTSRELEVLALIGQGLSTAEIAQALFRSVKTIEKHRESIGRKLVVTSRVELGRIATRAGLELRDAQLPRLDG